MEDGGNNFPNLTTSDGGNWSGMAVDHGNVSCSTQVTGATVIRGGGILGKVSVCKFYGRSRTILEYTGSQ